MTKVLNMQHRNSPELIGIPCPSIKLNAEANMPSKMF